MSQSYYQSKEKLTADEAELLVERFLNRDAATRVTRVKHVLEVFGYPYSPHNRCRVMDAMQVHPDIDEHNPERTGPTRFVIPEEYKHEAE